MDEPNSIQSNPTSRGLRGVRKSTLKLWWFWVGILLLVAIVLVGGLLHSGKKFKTEFYPSTASAPTLELSWDGTLDPIAVTRYTPYGIWEDWKQTSSGIAYEPANEMQFYVKNSGSPNYLAVAPGIITQKEAFNGPVGNVAVRYGENFAVVYNHIIPAKDLSVGQKIEVGDVLGKLEKKTNPSMGEEAWWEIQVIKYQQPYLRTVAPYQYFSATSKKLFDQIAANSKEKNNFWTAKADDPWTIVDGCSWLKYTQSWWTSFNKLGYTPKDAIEQSEEDFIKSVNPSWKVGDDQGRIIGPTDKCE